MKEKIEQIRQQALAAIEDAAGMDKLNDVKVAFLGKKGRINPRYHPDSRIYQIY